jgi:hypothetical protein
MNEVNMKLQHCVKQLTCICARRDPPLGLGVTVTGASIIVAMATPRLWHNGCNVEKKS